MKCLQGCLCGRHNNPAHYKPVTCIQNCTCKKHVPRTEEARGKMRAARMGVALTEATKEKMRETIRVNLAETESVRQEVRKQSQTRWIEKRWADQGIKMTVVEYDRLYQIQQGCCAICKRHQTELGNRALCVDHNHTTGKVRGLLCVKCNVRLDTFEDVDFTQKAKEYLETHNLK